MWQITKDHLNTSAGYGDTVFDRTGYGEDYSRIPYLAVALMGAESEELPGDPLPRIPFRLKDDDGEVYYSGWLNDDDECLNQDSALKYGADDAGCTTIEVKREGEWRVEIG